MMDGTISHGHKTKMGMETKEKDTCSEDTYRSIFLDGFTKFHQFQHRKMMDPACGSQLELLPAVMGARLVLNNRWLLAQTSADKQFFSKNFYPTQRRNMVLMGPQRTNKKVEQEQHHEEMGTTKDMAFIKLLWSNQICRSDSKLFVTVAHCLMDIGFQWKLDTNEYSSLSGQPPTYGFVVYTCFNLQNTPTLTHGTRTWIWHEDWKWITMTYHWIKKTHEQQLEMNMNNDMWHVSQRTQVQELKT